VNHDENEVSRSKGGAGGLSRPAAHFLSGEAVEQGGAKLGSYSIE
jgi:hypothetical protein